MYEKMKGSMVDNKSQQIPHPRQPKKRSWKIAFFVVLAVAILLGGLGTGATALWLFNRVNGNSPSLVTSGQDGNKTVTQQESDIAAVASKVSPSVVSITTSVQTRSLNGTTSQQGAGTGIIISKNGYIITNNHVIEGSTNVTVIDNDGNTYKNVTVLGRDPLNDAAFLKIDANKTFTPAEIGDSSTVRIGQQVVAIGNALGQYQNSVTSGILSGTGRPVTASSEDGSSSENLVDLLQTDASINPGNSGGPLLNLAGQVIGMNTAVANNANGIGFAIPINSEKGVMEGVVANGKIQRSFLGVNYIGITPEIAAQYNLPVTTGAYVNNDQGPAVQSGSPGDKAGLKQGDIIQKVNGYTIGSQGGLSSILGQYKPGQNVTMNVLRDGKPVTLNATLGMYSS